MKIAINGKIIDTENIYKINDIDHYISKYSKFQKWNYGWEDQDFFYFKINLFENQSILVKEKDLKTLEIFRDSIIKIWSENQSAIPQFNLE